MCSARWSRFEWKKREEKTLSLKWPRAGYGDDGGVPMVRKEIYSRRSEWGGVPRRRGGLECRLVGVSRGAQPTGSGRLKMGLFSENVQPAEKSSKEIFERPIGKERGGVE